MLLAATQWYFPLSVLYTFIIVNLLLSAEQLILELLPIECPSFFHDIAGNGFPVALQYKVLFFPSFTLSLEGSVIISGSSEVK